MLHTVTFDFWGTLYQNAYARDERLHLLEKVLARHSQPRPWTALEAAYRHAWSVWERTWREEQRSTTVEHWLREMLAFLKVALPDETLAGLCRPIEEIFLRGDAPRPVPGVAEVLPRLSRPGVAEVLPRLSRRYRLGLISDTGLTPGRVLREILRRDGLLPHFRALTFSDETGAAKPRPEQFLRTLNILEAQPEEAAHIGDLPETDIAGAQAVGMKAILFLGVSHRQDGRPLADAVFEKYSEIEEVLKNLTGQLDRR
jgi:putative hydrolase of the HAD superfamily